MQSEIALINLRWDYMSNCNLQSDISLIKIKVNVCGEGKYTQSEIALIR